MKEQGMSPTDPEYIKASQFLMNFQQQHNMRRTQQQFMQQQQKQQMQNATNGASTNGMMAGRPLPQGSPQTSQPAPNTLNASAMPNQSSTPASAGTSPSTGSSSNHFT